MDGRGDRETYRAMGFRGGDVLVTAGEVGRRRSRAAGDGMPETIEAGIALGAFVAGGELVESIARACAAPRPGATAPPPAAERLAVRTLGGGTAAQQGGVPPLPGRVRPPPMGGRRHVPELLFEPVRLTTSASTYGDTSP